MQQHSSTRTCWHTAGVGSWTLSGRARCSSMTIDSPPAHGNLCSLPVMSPTATINPPPNWPCWNMLQAGEGSPRCFQTSSHTWREQRRTVWEESCTHGPTVHCLLAYLLVSPPCHRYWAGIGQKDAERELEFDHTTVVVTLLHPFHLLFAPFDFYFQTGYANITLWWLFISFLAVYLPHKCCIFFLTIYLLHQTPTARWEKVDWRSWAKVRSRLSQG